MSDTKTDLCEACTATPGLKDANTLCPECKGTPSAKERAKLAGKPAKAAKEEAPVADAPEGDAPDPAAAAPSEPAAPVKTTAKK